MRKPSKGDLETVEWLAHIRWPKGIACPSCGQRDISELMKLRANWVCRSCRKQFGVFAGTTFEGTRLSPVKLAAAIRFFWDQSIRNETTRFRATKSLEELHADSKSQSSSAADSELEIMEALLIEGYSHAEIAFIIYGHGIEESYWHGAIGVRTLERGIGNYATAQRLHKKLTSVPVTRALKLEDYVAELLK